MATRKMTAKEQDKHDILIGPVSGKYGHGETDDRENAWWFGGSKTIYQTETSSFRLTMYQAQC
jgi:hypothetical protein